jgi:hypothetical protein
MESDHKSTRVDRQALYDQVWSQPMTTLAKEYGISDVALAKICKKLEVPYPCRGYWRKKKTGKTVEQLPLPSNTDSAKQTATIHGTILAEGVEHISEETIQRITAEHAPEQTIHVPDRLNKPHRLLNGHRTEWQSATVDEYGAIQSGSLRQLNMRISHQSLARAVRIMSTLLLALEVRSYPVAIQDGRKSSLCVRINGEPIQFGLEEKFKRSDRPTAKNLGLQSWERTRYDYTSTGTLFLRIKEWGADGLQKTWSDGKTAKIESYLNEFIIGLLKVADAVKAERLKREQEHQARLAVEGKREEEAKKRQEEFARWQSLEQEAANWAKAQQLRAYLAALKEMLITKQGEIQQGSQADLWLGWAYQHADRLDPLVSE